MRLVVQPGHGHLGAEQKVSAYGLFRGISQAGWWLKKNILKNMSQLGWLSHIYYIMENEAPASQEIGQRKW